MSSESPLSPAIRYDVEISGVREVSLVGSADLAFWRDRLAPEGFSPAPEDGRAKLMVSAANARFHGIPFRELSFSVFVSRSRDDEADRPEGVYLLHAFNSVRFFAFVERVAFSTPYEFGDLVVEVGPPARVELLNGRRPRSRVSFRIEMSPRAPASVGEDGFQGPIYLPRRAGGRGPRKLFHARLRGETSVTPFDSSRDTLEIGESGGAEVLDWLLASRFTAREWIVRPSATHGKSKTTSVGT